MSYKQSPFDNAPKHQSRKTRFNLSHEHKSHYLLGDIIPCMRPIETLPGDEFELNSEYSFRFAPLYFPIFTKITMRADTFFIPLRILWEKGVDSTGWKDWITKNEDIQPPIMNAYMEHNSAGATFSRNILAQMGVPLQPNHADWSDIIENLSAFPLSAYIMIWDWYYRVPQLEDPIWFNLEDADNTGKFNTAFGVGSGAQWNLLSSKWEKDYFTSANPSPQVGDPITIPLADPNDPRTGWIDSILGTPVTGAVSGATTPGGLPKSQIGATDVILDATATMRHLAEAEVHQEFLERIMKIGDQYDDFIDGLWGTKPQPGVINIPVLIGSSFGRVQVSDVLATASTATVVAQTRPGDYAATANMYAPGTKTMHYTCHEHGLILQLLQVNANTSYGQGIERLWRRSVQTDYALDMYASIGDQEILKEEVLYNGKTSELAKNFETFGYIDRFGDYKYKNNLHVHNMNWTHGLSMHLGRHWDQLTTIGAVYDDSIEINSPFINSTSNGTDFGLDAGYSTAGHRLVDNFRVLPVSSGQTTPNVTQWPTDGVIFGWIFHSIYVRRQLPLYSTPKL